VSIAEQLRDEVRLAEQRLAAVRATARVAAWLTGEDTAAGSTAAGDVIRALHPDGDPPPGWWATPLGVAVARHVGTEETIADPDRLTALFGLISGPWSRKEAGEVLGVTDGTVAQLLNRGTLHRHPGTHRSLNRASVLAYLARRRPRSTG
jgi:excisionase family DNA binding protein